MWHGRPARVPFGFKATGGPPVPREMAAKFDLTRLKSQIKPFRLYWFPRLRSTNDHAARLRKRRELFAPAIVLTGKQVKGRGRGTNTWWSAPGSLTATFVLPIQDHLEPQQIPLLAGLVVRDVIADLTHESTIQLKWPNDVMYRDRKLAGLLCERIEKADLVGVGINANVVPGEGPKSLRKKITSMSLIARRSIDRNELVIALADGFARMISRDRERPFAAALKEYGRHHALVGRRVTVRSAGEDTSVSGVCSALDASGRLLLRSGGRMLRIVAGHVEIHAR